MNKRPAFFPVLSLFAALLSLGMFMPSASASENLLFLGTDLGYLGLSSSRLLEVDKSGVEAGIKLVGSHEFDSPWLIDVGGGYLYSYLSGEGLGTVKNIKVITRSFYAELSPRYRFDAHWQAGPVVQFLTGGDVSYDEDGNVDELKSQWRGGARVQYEVGDDWRWRFGLQGFTDLNIDSRRIIGVVADIQFGFPFRSHASETSTENSVQKPDFAEVKGKSIRIYLGDDLLRFDTAGTALDAKSKQALHKLAKVLRHHRKDWIHLRIEGHCDERNVQGLNQKLSESRAQTVKTVLVKEKLPAQNMSVEGLAATRPIDPAHNARAYALNRRVEIWLDDIRPDAIPAVMAELKK